MRKVRVRERLCVFDVFLVFVQSGAALILLFLHTLTLSLSLSLSLSLILSLSLFPPRP